MNRIGKVLREREDRRSPVYKRDTDMSTVDMVIVIAAFSFFVAWIILEGMK